MEYIPSGLSKAQWAAIKKKEADDKDAKSNGLGATRFKSRSFEAWHKAGAKHLFPVDPTDTSYEERPYMQRKNGDWEGSDLSAKGLVGKGQGVASKRLKFDDMYEKAKKAGKMDSVSIFGGASLPWTNAAATKMEKENDPSKALRAKATKKLSEQEMKRLKANLVKVSVSEKADKKAKEEAAPKKGLFGLF